MHDINIDTLHGSNSYYLIAGCCLFVAEWIKTLDGYHVPEIVMQLFQIFAWSAAGFSCLMGLYLAYKKSKVK